MTDDWLHGVTIIDIKVQLGYGGGVFPVSIPYEVVTTSGESLVLYMLDYGQEGWPDEWPEINDICSFKIEMSDTLIGVVSDELPSPPYHDVSEVECR